MTEDWRLAIRRSARAKRLRIVVRPAGVELVIPPGISESVALNFLHGRRVWVQRKLAEAAAASGPGQPQAYRTGATLPFQDREVPLLVQPQPRRRASVEYDGRLVVTVPAGLQRESSDNVQALVVAWMKTWLRGQATEAIAQHGQTAGLRPRTIRIKKMTTRWGSCGPRNDINLNWLLAFTPPEVLEYVVVHEICHIRYRNHSPQFWGLVARHLPEYGSARVWLKQRGAELLRRFP